MLVDSFGDSDELVEGEVVDVVETRRGAVVRRATELAPVAKTAAVATVGAAVGAATAVVVAKAASRPGSRSLGSRRNQQPTFAIESTTSYLIDIHRLVRQ